MAAPVLNFHYSVILQAISKETTAIATFKKMVFDQTIFAPCFLIYVFVVMPKFDGKSNEEAINSAKEKLWPTMLTNWKVWPFVQFMNFKFIPVTYHILVVNSVAIWWNAYVSWMVNKNKDNFQSSAS